MKTIVCSPENFSHVCEAASSPTEGNQWRGLPVQVDRFIPTWKEYPRPKWWRRWFLREKQKPRERVFFVLDLPPRPPMLAASLPLGWSLELKSPWLKLQ